MFRGLDRFITISRCPLSFTILTILLQLVDFLAAEAVEWRLRVQLLLGRVILEAEARNLLRSSYRLLMDFPTYNYRERG